jgi:hypothetical protein
MGRRTMRYQITISNHGGTVRIVSKKPYRDSETKDVVSIEYEDRELDETIETEVREEEEK